MQDSKEIVWGSEYIAEHDEVGGTPEVKTAQHAAAAPEADAWQQYRKWISSAPAPRGRRNGLDPSLYTWKGYRNWTEQVKRNWSDK
ncbi:MAG: hypothetical protein BMS9Abin32_395 [Gammaproteobacteria bacterium]|nr:MAG: hypothetical protein BMS9Abin32_395 [Gammaproteobacteria bacterium]